MWGIVYSLKQAVDKGFLVIKGERPPCIRMLERPSLRFI
jgi:hypothetical protein